MTQKENVVPLEKKPLRGKRIVLLGEYISSGGTKTYFERLIRFYASQNVLLTVVSFDKNPVPEVIDLVDSFGFAHLRYSDLMRTSDVESQPEPRVWSLFWLLKERKVFKKLTESFDSDYLVISSGTPGLFAGASRSHRGTIYILHTYPHGRRQRLLGRLVMSRFFREDTRFVAVSRFEQNQVARYWNREPDSKVLRTILSTTGPVEIPKELEQYPHSTFTILCVAGVIDYKQPLLWVEVAKYLTLISPEWHINFLWVGEGPMLKKIEDLLASDSALANIHFIGYRSDPTEFYRRASIYMQLSSIETLGLAAIDALRFGVPAVVSDVGGLPEVVAHNQTGLVLEAGDAISIAKQVRALLSDSETMARMKTSSLERYRNNFSEFAWESAYLGVHFD